MFVALLSFVKSKKKDLVTIKEMSRMVNRANMAISYKGYLDEEKDREKSLQQANGSTG